MDSALPNLDTSFLTASEAANLLRVQPQTLAVWRLEGRGPRWHKVSRRVLYATAEIGRYLAAHEFGGTSETRAPRAAA